MTATTSSAIRSAKARELQGKRAGLASRVTANAVDWCIVVAIYIAILLGIALADYFLGSGQFDVPSPTPGVTFAVEWVIAVLYLTAGWTGTGRTIGKGIMGLRVVTNSGEPLWPRRSFFRALICATIGPIALAWALVSRRRAGIHDVVLQTTVVHDWTTRS